jgi:hypothetical protein
MSGLKRNDITLIKDILLTDSINVNIIGGGGGGGGGGGDVVTGAYNNMTPTGGTLNAGANSTGLMINNLFGNESVISYQDGAPITTTSFISIYGSLDGAEVVVNPAWFYIGVLQPVVLRADGPRQASSVLKLKGLKRIRIRNEGTVAVTGILCTLFSG